jgi:hypothetical protein
VQYERLTYPRYDTPLIEAYDGRFESVFVVLHPFVRVPEMLAWQATKQYPSDEQIAMVGTRCTWAEVSLRTGLHACAKLNQALLTSILSVKDELCDFEARDAMHRFLESEPVWMPAEGRFEPLLQMDLLDAFEAAGKEELVFMPEFPDIDEVKHFEVARLKSGEETFPSRGSLVAPDSSFLFTVDWDSFFTLFYGPREFVSDVVRRSKLEGFFANLTTEHFWFNYSMGCATVTISPEHWPAF